MRPDVLISQMPADLLQMFLHSSLGDWEQLRCRRDIVIHRIDSEIIIDRQRDCEGPFLAGFLFLYIKSVSVPVTDDVPQAQPENILYTHTEVSLQYECCRYTVIRTEMLPTGSHGIYDLCVLLTCERDRCLIGHFHTISSYFQQTKFVYRKWYQKYAVFQLISLKYRTFSEISEIRGIINI